MEEMTEERRAILRELLEAGWRCARVVRHAARALQEEAQESRFDAWNIRQEAAEMRALSQTIRRASRSTD
jgi:hypothetical protein